MLAHTFAGTSLRSMLGLEEQQSVFERYRRIRRRDREYMELPPGVPNQPLPEAVA